MRNLVLSSILFVFLVGCQPASPAATNTPGATNTPAPPTATPTPPTGIAGAVSYTGSSEGGILLLAVDQPPVQGENPVPVAIDTIDSANMEFQWELPAGTYYVTAFFTIGREPQGPPLPNEPVISCDPIQVAANETVQIQITLNDPNVEVSTCVVEN